VGAAPPAVAAAAAAAEEEEEEEEEGEGREDCVHKHINFFRQLVNLCLDSYGDGTVGRH
jgi:hypothetical protein